MCYFIIVMSVYDVVDVVFYFRLWKRKKPLFARGSEKISIWISQTRPTACKATVVNSNFYSFRCVNLQSYRDPTYIAAICTCHNIEAKIINNSSAAGFAHRTS